MVKLILAPSECVKYGHCLWEKHICSHFKNYIYFKVMCFFFHPIIMYLLSVRMSRVTWAHSISKFVHGCIHPTDSVLLKCASFVKDFGTLGVNALLNTEQGEQTAR